MTEAHLHLPDEGLKPGVSTWGWLLCSPSRRAGPKGQSAPTLSAFPLISLLGCPGLSLPLPHLHLHPLPYKLRNVCSSLTLSLISHGHPILLGTVTHPWAPLRGPVSPQNWQNSCRRSSQFWTGLGEVREGYSGDEEKCPRSSWSCSLFFLTACIFRSRLYSQFSPLLRPRSFRVMN